MNKATSLILLTALMTSVFTSCSSSDEKVESNDNVIRFDTSVGGVNTRNDITSETFSSFNVTALGDASPYFQNLGVSRQSGGTWQTASTKYWPSYPLNFYGYAPTSLQDKVSITTTAKTIAGFSPVSTVAQQVDVLTSYVQATQSSNGGAAVLDFKHALTQIEVLAKNGLPDKYSVEVLGVKICRIPSTASLNFQEAADEYPTWSSATGDADYILKSASGPLTLDQEARSIMFGPDNFLMIPQTLTPWSAGATADGAYISVLCRIKDQLGNLIYPTDATKFGFAALPATQTWRTGHKCTYTIAFFTNGGGAGLIDPDPTNPENPDDPDVDPNPGGSDKGPGDLVVPDSEIPISVSVNITDWLSGADDNIDIEF